jgi:hypothetical protein
MDTGLIPEGIQPFLGFLGGVGGELPDILPSGDWEPYLPLFEYQQKLNLETLGCVSFSRLNASEIQARFYGKNLNFSDRSLAWASNTTHNGNTFSAVDFWFRQRGASDESCWPWVVPLTWEEYYATPSPIVQNQMLLIWDEWSIGTRVFVPNNIEDMKAALKKGPLWFCTNDHAMVIYRVDTEIHIFDTYGQNGDGRKTKPLSFADQIVSAYLVPFIPKQQAPKPMIVLPKNCLVIVVDGLGERLMNVDGTKLYQDDAGKILTEVMARNAVPNAQGVLMAGMFPEVHVKTSDIAGIPRYNLKGQPL